MSRELALGLRVANRSLLMLFRDAIYVQASLLYLRPLTTEM